MLVWIWGYHMVRARILTCNSLHFWRCEKFQRTTKNSPTERMQPKKVIIVLSQRIDATIKLVTIFKRLKTTNSPSNLPTTSTASLPTTNSPSNLPTTMQCSHITNERDDCGVPWISTNSPERARMGTDTVPVHPAMVPVNGESTASLPTTNSPSNLPTTSTASLPTTNSPSNLPTTMNVASGTDDGGMEGGGGGALAGGALRYRTTTKRRSWIGSG